MPHFPHYKQLDAMDCGPSCLRMIAKFYGRNYSMQHLRGLSYITRQGVSMLGISEAGESIGFRTKAYRLTWEELCSEVPFPCIVHWKQNHFVVVYDIKKKRGRDIIYLADPAISLLQYSKEEFLKCWHASSQGNKPAGHVLLFETTPVFYQKNEEDRQNKLTIRFLIGYLRPYKKYLIQLGLAMVTGSLVSLIFPFLTQAVVDYGIGNSDLNFILMVIIAQVTLTTGNMANDMIRSWVLLHVTTRISISLISDFLIKLIRLPISFFDTKLIGDIMQRIGDHGRIQSFLTGSLISIIFAVFTLIIYSFIMASYHLGILGIFMIGSILHVCWVVIFLKRRKELDYKRFQQASANQSNIVQLITGMQEIKLNGCEQQKRWEWERIQAKLFKISVKGLILSQTQQVGAAFINQAKNVFISYLAAKSVVTGDMTLGMMMAMQYIIGQLNAPFGQFIGFIQAAQDAHISMERLSEIHERDDEENAEHNLIKEIPRNKGISIRNVTFQYEGPHSDKVLDKFNLEIPVNKVTAIVGASGSGKTTLIKLLLGFYTPTEGEILLDNRKLSQYSPREWRKQCGVVMQEGFIFSDNISNNIGAVDEYPEFEKIEQAALTSNIKETIEEMPLSYNTKIGTDGTGLSTGQKQRILIARAVYKDPAYIFLDEATNSLDASNERMIMENLEQFFKARTVVIVAHRLSTVKKADQIVVLDKGKLLEQGTHNELVLRKGEYYRLVKDQLDLGA